MKYWLMKSEPDCYSIDDLKKDKKTPWEGVRNYQARNYMRDDMKSGDKVIFYHSNAKPPHIAGFGKVSGKSYPDKTQFDKKSEYFDPKSTEANPRWFLVDVEFVAKAKRIITLNEIKNEKELGSMLVAKPGMRLSIMPVLKEDFEIIKRMSMRTNK